MRLSKVTADSSGAQLSVAGTLDLTDGSSTAGWCCRARASRAGARPDIYLAFKGPLAAPQRTIDVSALTGWLTLAGDRKRDEENTRHRAAAAAAHRRRCGRRAKRRTARKNEAAAAPSSPKSEARARLAAAGRDRTLAGAADALRQPQHVGTQR